MAGGHKKVISVFAGTAWLRSCRFLFHQFVHRDKTHKVIRDADALSALPAALVRCFDVDALDKLPQGVGGHFLQILVYVYPLDELLQIFNLSFLYFNILLQGLETLSLRVERHVANALKVGKYLSGHPKVTKVNHPLLPDHPDHELYKKYFPKGAGSIFTFEIEGGQEAALKFIDSLEIFSLLANVADVKSLVIHP